MTIPILVTSVGTTTAQSAIKSLRKAQKHTFRIVGTDINPQRLIPRDIFCNMFYSVPRFDHSDYLTSIISISKKEKIALILPIYDQEVNFLAKQRKKLAKENIIVLCSEYETVKRCNDKFETYNFLKEKSEGIVPTWTINQLTEVKKHLKPPFFIKPRIGVGSIDCYRIENAAELDVLVHKIIDPIIQPYIDGDKYVLDILNDLEGKNLVVIPRLEMSSKAGIGVKAVTRYDQQLIAYGRKISELVKIKGPANIEVFVNDRGIFLIEINPRLSAGSIISTQAGVNIPDLTVQLFLNKKIPPQLNWRTDVTMIRYWEEVFYS